MYGGSCTARITSQYYFSISCLSTSGEAWKDCSLGSAFTLDEDQVPLLSADSSLLFLFGFLSLARDGRIKGIW